MHTQSETLSNWFVLNSGFKVQGRCPHCDSQNISFYKERPQGLKGISFRSKGLTPACLDCGKGLPAPKKDQGRLSPLPSRKIQKSY